MVKEKGKYVDFWQLGDEKNISETPKEFLFNDLEKFYTSEGVIVPIYPVQDKDETLYKYRFFPKLIDSLMLSSDALANIDWPMN